ncbi:MAG: sensor histidine kinase [Clostridiales bacterium]|nr:sensor histidine kinase [Clostridiales bacterium]
MKTERKAQFVSIRFQMVILFFLFTAGLAVTMGAVSFRYISRSEKKLAIERAVMKSEQIGSKARSLLDEANVIFAWSKGVDVGRFLRAGEDRYNETMQLIQDLSGYRDSGMLGRNVDNIYIFDLNGLGFDERKGIYPTARYAKSGLICETARNQTDQLIFGSFEGRKYLVYGKEIHESTTGNLIGYAAVEFPPDVFDDLIRESRIGQNGSFFITDEYAAVLVGANPVFAGLKKQGWSGWSEKQSYQILSDKSGEKILLVYNRIPNTRWMVAGSVYFNEMMEQSKYIRMMLALISMGLIAVSTCGYFLAATRITRPITRMKKQMLEVAGGNLDATIDGYTHNEFGILERQYNRMLGELKRIIDTHNKDQEYLQKAEFKALQAQITPHFLYNTLDTIIWMVAVNENENAIGVLENLAVFFKTGLSNGMDWIPVKSEVEHVKSYLYIQEIRYKDLLTSKVRIDQDLMQYDMLKMTLQPIVENAISHGIRNKENGGIVSIRGYFDQDDYIVLEIADTGVGMEEEEVRLLNRNMRENRKPYNAEGKGFGLYNVNRRIRLYYADEKCGLTVSSRPYEGTTVRVTLRKIRRQGQNV